MGTKQKFGVGSLIARLQYDARGNALAVPMPVRLAILQDISTDFSFEKKLLYGSGQLPVDTGRGKAALNFSAKTASIDAGALAALHFGVTPQTGFSGPVMDEAHAIPAAEPFTITIAPPNAGNYTGSLGVTDTSGNALTPVAAAPATGQYMASAGGVFTFAAADEGKGVLISYEYTSTTAGGIIVPLTNQLMGYSPSFAAILYNDSKGSKLTMKLNACTSDKLSMPFKNDDWVVADFGFSANDDGTGSAGYWSQL